MQAKYKLLPLSGTNCDVIPDLIVRDDVGNKNGFDSTIEA